MKTSRPVVCIVTPALREANTGNWHTAARWARFLRPDHRVRVQQHWDGASCDVLIALHARRSADSIAAFRAAHPDGPLGVILTGTDLYRDLPANRDAQRSLALADRLVVLQESGVQAVPAQYRGKTSVIFQSARKLTRGARRRRTFDVAVVGHLREEKDPLLAMHVALSLGSGSHVRLLHAGAALDTRYGAAARRTEARTARYRWLGELPRARARQLMRHAALVFHPSRVEGGAQVVLEAIRSGTPVVVSDADGNLGMVGRDYPGVFPVGAVRAATQLLERASTDRAFLRRLASACRARAWLFDPKVERAAVRDLVRGLIHNHREEHKRAA
ncbi:MAG TPA: selenoneine biosynthesis selenosugar synthase SenB [Burkholderiaceae bacterium]|nr:selenoneine biosynthesis selenosugar synthase SenB [Burkholderiaceae bacterium]HQR69717.1 selenoneine biosynthesis selenosugar synthase SenB [Burkholderiaceae bacterium]